MDYRDPRYVEGVGKCPAFLLALQQQQQRAILTSDDVFPNPNDRSGLGFKRTGYIAIFRVSMPVVSDGSLRLTLLDKLEELR
jgi:hypothetical protein